MNTALKLRVAIALNVLLYGAIILLGAWPIVTKQHDSSSGFVALFILLSIFLTFSASVCGGICYLILRLKTDDSTALLRTLVPLCIAPFFSISLFWFCDFFAKNSVNPLAIPIFFMLPFVVTLSIPRPKAHS